MNKRKPLTDDDGEVRELMSADLKEFRGAEEILSASLMQKLMVRGRATQVIPKERSRYGYLEMSLKGFARLEKVGRRG